MQSRRVRVSGERSQIRKFTRISSAQIQFIFRGNFFAILKPEIRAASRQTEKARRNCLRRAWDQGGRPGFQWIAIFQFLACTYVVYVGPGVPEEPSMA